AAVSGESALGSRTNGKSKWSGWTPSARDRRHESSTSGRAPPGSSRPTDRNRSRARWTPEASEPELIDPSTRPLTNRPETVFVRRCRSAAAGRMTAAKTDTVDLSLRHAASCLPLGRGAAALLRWLADALRLACQEGRSTPPPGF